MNRHILIALLLCASLLQANPDDAVTLDLQTHLQAPNQGDPGLFDQSNILIAAGFGSICMLDRSHKHCESIACTLESSPLDFYFDLGNGYGQGNTMGVIAVGLYGVGKATENERMIATGGDLTKSLLATWAVTWALKLSANSERPNGHGHSFPSGHTSTAFAAAPIFHKHYGALVGVGAYALATITGLARIEHRMHHPVDVVAGAAIGIIAGRTVARSIPLRVMPSPNGPAIGIIQTF